MEMKNDIVTIRCYGQIEKLPRLDAIKKYREALNWSDGSEHARYLEVYSSLLEGATYCTDGVDDYA